MAPLTLCPAEEGGRSVSDAHDRGGPSRTTSSTELGEVPIWSVVASHAGMYTTHKPSEMKGPLTITQTSHGGSVSDSHG